MYTKIKLNIMSSSFIRSHDTNEIDDMIQDALLELIEPTSRMFQALGDKDKFAVPARASSYFKSYIVRYMMAARRRERLRHSRGVARLRFAVFGRGSRVPDKSANPEDAAVSGETREEVWRALSTLPDVELRAIVATELEGRPIKEAAKELGVSSATVRRRARCGRERLAVVLGAGAGHTGAVTFRARDTQGTAK